ncbi:hypothetical protein Pla163_10260 [Planctomycetes bacterium Pla163]|uniref:Tetratricopeptide repeat protein n=1 Tax=Rohdeia mirabilis TaxID=2528008 RepID=A0A518CXH1_9BACT|nr:hypothetical protein Pla163_10260 [Planctomycetes bacterium Pla163]
MKPTDSKAPRSLRTFALGSLFASALLSSCLDAGATSESNPSTATAQSPEPSTPVASSDEVAATVVLVEPELEAFQIELLDLAFDVASAVPSSPHHKTRGALQEEVATCALRLDQHERALAYADRIENWRRGNTYADVAMFLSERGAGERAAELIESAREIALATDPDLPQSWRAGRILAKIAYVLVVLDRTDEADRLAGGLESSDQGIVDKARALTMEPEDFERRMRAVDEVVRRGDLEQVAHAFEACVELYDRFYADEARRALVLEKLRGSWKQVPIPVRLDITLQLVDVALGRDDAEGALVLLEDAQTVVDGSKWRVRDLVPMKSRLAVMRFRCGDEAGGRSALVDALATYDEEWPGIVDIWRAETLRPVAESFFAFGDRERALSLYRRVVSDGVTNPNSKPRAEDLVATLCSLALHGIAPDEELREALSAARAGLSDPW